MKVCYTDELAPIPTISELDLVKLRNDYLGDDTLQLVESIPTFTSCKNTMYNKPRIPTLQVLPKTVDDINSIWAQTTKGNPILLEDDNVAGGMLMFSTEKNVSYLSAA